MNDERNCGRLNEASFVASAIIYGIRRSRGFRWSDPHVFMAYEQLVWTEQRR